MKTLLIRSTVLLLLMSLFTAVVNAANTAIQLSKTQENLLIKAHKVWSEVGYPETGQAILLQETQAGKFGNGVGDRDAPVGQRSYGDMQVKVSTVRFVLSKFPEMKRQYFPTQNLANVADEELIVKLITDSEFNMLIAAKNFYLMMKFSNNDWPRAVAAYNMGWTNAQKLEDPKGFIYTQHIARHLSNTVRPFNVAKAKLLSFGKKQR